MKQKDNLDYKTCRDKPTSLASQSKHSLGRACCWTWSTSLGTDLSVLPRNTQPLLELLANVSEYHKGAHGAFLHERIRMRIRSEKRVIAESYYISTRGGSSIEHGCAYVHPIIFFLQRIEVTEYNTCIYNSGADRA
jgi:hypothetical protein